MPTYSRHPADQYRQPIASARDYTRALQSGDLFRALDGRERATDPIVEDILNMGVPFHKVLARAVGLDDNLKPSEIVRRMLGTGDLAALLVPGRVELIQATFAPWVGRFTKILKRWPVPNFLPTTLHSFGVSSPVPVPEFASHTFGSITTPAATESLSVVANGLSWLLSRQMIVNGDLALMTALESQIATVFAAYFRTALATALEATDTMPDGSAFFHAGAGNLVASGGAPSVTTLDFGTNLMAQQTLPGGQRCGLVPRFLVVPATLAATAAVLARVVYETSSPTPFEIVVLPELAGTFFYLVADPNLSPTLGLMTVGNAERLLYVESGPSNSTADGVSMRASMDFRIARVSRVGIVKYSVT